MESLVAIYQDSRNKPAKSDEDNLVGLGIGSANYWFTFVTDPLTVFFFLFWEAFILRSSLVISLFSYAAGLFAWSLVEYSFHRCIYHKGRTPAHAGHQIHHRSPETLIAMPWFVVTGLFALVWYVFAYMLQFRFALSFAGGLLSGFVVYGAFHHLHHHSDFKSRHYRKLRAHHFIHHRFPDVNFGVTSRLWDHVFGTTYKHKMKRQPCRNEAGTFRPRERLTRKDC